MLSFAIRRILQMDLDFNLNFEFAKSFASFKPNLFQARNAKV
jgi:hypothetical protein